MMQRRKNLKKKKAKKKQKKQKKKKAGIHHTDSWFKIKRDVIRRADFWNESGR